MRKSVEFGEMPNFFPTPVVLVSCKHREKDNIISLAWVGVVCSNPAQVAVAIRPSRFSHKLIEESKEFVVNVPSAEMVKAVNGCGATSGSDTDKFEKFNLTREQASKVSAPLIKECPISIECKLKQKISLGTHDLFIGEIAAVQVDEKFLKGKEIDFSAIKPLAMMRGNYFAAGEKVGGR